jgi:CRISPR system Cascade subunit CasD
MLEPSKSGVIGLLCAALGKPRDENNANNKDKPTLKQLADLRMGVRINQEGVMQKDYHTAGGSRHNDYGVVKASGTKGETVVSTRYYIANADFLVGLECDEVSLLEQIDNALHNPHWQIFLGRKSFVPSLPVHLPDGLMKDVSLEAALKRFDKWTMTGKLPEQMRQVIEPSGNDSNATEVRHDVPLSFSERRFTIRYVKTTWIALKKGVTDE